jgi:nitrogen regulatory protein P-II 2
MVKLETVVPDELLPQVLDTIQRAAATGRSGDGKVFVLPVESALKIRSGEVGPKVL